MLLLALTPEKPPLTIQVSFSFFLPGKYLIKLATLISPAPLRYFVYDGPIVDHGKHVQMGVAYFVPPGGELRGKPSSFVCNIGDIPTNPQSGRNQLLNEADYMAVGHVCARARSLSPSSLTRSVPQAHQLMCAYPAGCAGAQATINMVQSLTTPEASERGFHGQYLAQFPREGGDGVKQLNLTAWTDERAAHDWYSNNEEHKRIVQQYRSGSLMSFSSMLARLQCADEKPVQWQSRCWACAALVTGYPERQFCKVCGARTKGMPLF